MAPSPADPDRNRTATERLSITVGSREFGSLLVLVGLVHVLVPNLLLRIARIGYERILDVGFRPRENATGRVRAIGFAMLAAGFHLLYHGGLLPDEEP